MMVSAFGASILSWSPGKARKERLAGTNLLQDYIREMVPRRDRAGKHNREEKPEQYRRNLTSPNAINPR